MTVRFAVWSVGATLLVVVPLLIVHAQTTTPEVLPEEPMVEGQVLGITTDAITTGAGTTTESTAPVTETASSTEPVSAPAIARIERTMFLQTGVKMEPHNQAGLVAATITLQNLTCRECETASPSATVKVFYTEWFDNDGVDHANATTTTRLGEQTFSTSSIPPWQSQSVQWQADIPAAGRYSLVVLVDPDNTIGAKDTYRTEFFVD